ncbi:MAG: PIN domain-containing protein [Candidatus Blackburnbacteria bacterium]|nr:PIN domain-containing protein [Candidatus Blackburnbacteria bacterium]
MRKTKVFVDSDVVISSLLSEKGAAYLLLNEQKSNFVISNISKTELEVVIKRLKIDQNRLQTLVKKHLKVIKLKKEISRIKKDFRIYTTDIDDTHIVAGAASSKAKFLLTYNIRHFQRQKINEDLGIVVLNPAQYLQYLKSLE